MFWRKTGAAPEPKPKVRPVVEPMIVGRHFIAEHNPRSTDDTDSQPWEIYILHGLAAEKNDDGDECRYYCWNRADADALIVALDRTWEADHAKPEDAR